MNAVPYTNPPNDRSRRKFIAGHLWEFIVSMVLTMTGVLKEKQLRGEVELAGLLKVSGKLDFVAGGLIDWEKARFEIARVQQVFRLTVDEMPPFIFHAIEHILSDMEKRYEKNPLKEVVFECKSVSSFMSERIQRTNTPMPHHVLQCFHYLLSNKMDESLLVYISKDDCIATEFSVPNNKAALRFYMGDVKQMTEYYSAGFNEKKPLAFAPPKENEILFDDVLFRFQMNFRVEYSNYLKMLHGYDTPEDYRLRWQKDVASWNRVFKRCVRQDKMTDMNKTVLKEAVKIFPQWDKYVLKARLEGAFLKPELEETE